MVAVVLSSFIPVRAGATTLTVYEPDTPEPSFAVAVMVAVPTALPVTIPVLDVTDATSELELE